MQTILIKFNITHDFLKKTNNSYQTRKEGNFLNLLKSIYKGPITSIVTNGELLKAFSQD